MAEDNIYQINKKIIYKSKLDEKICLQAVDLINKIQSNFTDKSWDCPIRTSLNTTYNILNIIGLFDLKMHILSKVNLFMYENNNICDGYLSDSWVNIYEKNFFQEYHTHISNVDKFICGVVYLTDNNSQIHFNLGPEISPKFGDILIFNDDDMHRVLPNEKDDLRISLAFNYKKCREWKGIKIEK